MSKLMMLATQLQERQNQLQKGASNRKKWYDLRNIGTDTTELYIYDDIGDDGWGGGVTQQDFVNDLKGVTTPYLDVHYASQGGSVFEGIAMYEAMKQHPAVVTSLIDSIAASAASFMAMAANPYDASTGKGGVRMGRNARIMIHGAATGVGIIAGNAKNIREQAAAALEAADFLDEMSDNIADIYMQKAGGTVADWRALMEDETWFSASQAIDAKLADGIIGEMPETTSDVQNKGTTEVTNTVPVDKVAERYREFMKKTKGVLV